MASSSCYSVGSSHLFDTGGKKHSKGDFAVFEKVMRGVMNEENQRLSAMGMSPGNQDGTAGRISPQQQWKTSTLPRMKNDQFEVGIESEYHDFDDDEDIHRRLSSPPTRASAAPNASAAASRSKFAVLPSNNGRRNQKSTAINEWPPSFC